MPTPPDPNPHTPMAVRLAGHRNLGTVQARYVGPWLELEDGTRYGPAAVYSATPVKAEQVVVRAVNGLRFRHRDSPMEMAVARVDTVSVLYAPKTSLRRMSATEWKAWQRLGTITFPDDGGPLGVPHPIDPACNPPHPGLVARFLWRNEWHILVAPPHPCPRGAKATAVPESALVTMDAADWDETTKHADHQGRSVPGYQDDDLPF